MGGLRGIGLGIIEPKVGPAALLADESAGNHEPRDEKHILQLPPGRIGELTGGNVAGPEFDLTFSRLEP